MEVIDSRVGGSEATAFYHVSIGKFFLDPLGYGESDTSQTPITPKAVLLPPLETGEMNKFSFLIDQNRHYTDSH
jgi:hypothetical protein